MKKTIISIAVASAAIFSGTAFAQTTTTSAAKNGAACTEQCVNGKEQKGQKPCPFDGLNLTAKQQESLKALNEQTMKARQEAGKQAKADKQKQHADRKAAKQAARKEYLAKVKAILTPEQYVQFLENNYVNAAPQMKGDRKGHKGPCMGEKKGNRPDGKKGDRRPDAPKGDRK